MIKYDEKYLRLVTMVFTEKGSTGFLFRSISLTGLISIGMNCGDKEKVKNKYFTTFY